MATEAYDRHDECSKAVLKLEAEVPPFWLSAKWVCVCARARVDMLRIYESQFQSMCLALFDPSVTNKSADRGSEAAIKTERSGAEDCIGVDGAIRSHTDRLNRKFRPHCFAVATKRSRRNPQRHPRWIVDVPCRARFGDHELLWYLNRRVKDRLLATL